MGLELVIFIGAILLGIFIYWRESQGNKFYRFINKIFNSKELQMKAKDKKGFVFKQPLLPRLVYITGFFLVLGIIIQFLTPFQIFTNYYGLSAIASTIIGILIGSYLANFILKSGEIIEEKSESIEDIVSDTIEKGKDFIEDLTTKDVNDVVEQQKESPKVEGKSARERLKDKGLM